MKIDKQTVITVAVIGALLGLLLVCSIIESLRLPMCAIQVFLIGLVSLKWEEDAWLATGSTHSMFKDHKISDHQINDRSKSGKISMHCNESGNRLNYGYSPPGYVASSP